MATNQVDMMCSIANNIDPNLRILGLTGLVDSSRFNQIAKDKFNLNLKCLIIGLHNNSMFPLYSSISNSSCENSIVNEIMSNVVKLGKKISDEQKKGIENLGINTSASILPAYSMIKLVNGYCFGKKFIESFNIRINDKNTSVFYNVPIGANISVPVEITKNKFKIVKKYHLNDKEKDKMMQCYSELQHDLDLLKNHTR